MPLLLIADRDTARREAVAGICRGLLPDREIVAVGDRDHVESVLARTRPEVAVLEADLSGLHPDCTSHDIARILPDARVVLLSPGPIPIVGAQGQPSEVEVVSHHATAAQIARAVAHLCGCHTPAGSPTAQEPRAGFDPHAVRNRLAGLVLGLRALADDLASEPDPSTLPSVVARNASRLEAILADLMAAIEAEVARREQT